MKPDAVTALLTSVGLPSAQVSCADGVCEADVYPAGAYRKLKHGYSYAPIGYYGVCGRLRKAGVVLMRAGYEDDGAALHIVFRVEETGE